MTQKLSQWRTNASKQNKAENHFQNYDLAKNIEWTKKPDRTIQKFWQMIRYAKTNYIPWIWIFLPEPERKYLWGDEPLSIIYLVKHITDIFWYFRTMQFHGKKFKKIYVVDYGYWIYVMTISVIYHIN